MTTYLLANQPADSYAPGSFEGGPTSGVVDNTNPRNDNVQQIAIFAEGFNTGGGCIPQFDVCPYDVPVIPTGATVRDFTLATFATVKNQARPGDWLRMVESVDTSSAGALLECRGPRAPSGTPDVVDGLPGLPITITFAEGVTMRNRNVTSNSAICIDLKGTIGWNVVGTDVTGGYMCIRAMSAAGHSDDPAVIAGNRVKDSSQTKISVGGWWQTPDTASENWRVYSNEVSGWAPTVSSEHSEGIYFGTGSIPRYYKDRTSGIYCGYNHIYNLQSDAIEFKNGVSDYVCEGNRIHDLDLTQGTNPIAAINCNYGAQPQGGGATVPADYSGANGVVRKNRVWALTTPDSRPAINVGIGGVTVEDNLTWGHGAAPGVRLRSEMEFKTDPILIRGNTFGGGGVEDPGNNKQTAGGATGALTTVTTANNIRLGGFTADYQASSTDFVGPITGDADNGEGPGSGFQLNATSGANNTGDAGGIMTECPSTPPHLGALPQAISSGTGGGGSVSGGGSTGGGTPSGDSEFSISGNDIKAPDNSNWWGGAVNVAGWAGVAFNYVWEGRDNAGRVDVWPGEPNIDNGTEVYPGGVVTSANQYDVSTSQTRLIPDRAYALNGQLSQAAANAGITQPPDHWHQKLVRINAVPRGGNSNPNPDQSIPAYMQGAQELIDLGLVVVMPIHNMTGQNVPLPASFISDPTVDYWNIPDQKHSDAARLIDAMCAQFGTNGSGSGPGTANVKAGHMWISLPNEPFTGARNSDYDNHVKTYVRRIRATGAKNIISVPLAQYGQDLGGCADGDYNSLLADLQAEALAYNLIWEWHAYGADYASDVPQWSYYSGQTGYDRILAHIDQAQGHGFKIWIGEYGKARPATAGNAGAWQGNVGAQEAIATNAWGTPIGELRSVVPCAWHFTGDNSGYELYAMFHGPAPRDETNTSGLGVPGWDIDGTNLDMLTEHGLAHWNVSHAIWSKTT